MERPRTERSTHTAPPAGLARRRGGPAISQEPIKIGWIGPLSGWGAPGGTAIMRGSQLAMDHVNAAGGIDGRKIVLVSRDSEATPAKGVTVARELIEDRKS